VFAINTDGTGFTNLHNFSQETGIRAGGSPINNDGASPVAFGLRCWVVLERRAYAEAAAALALTEAQLQHRVSNLGRQQSGPWRAEQKMAALVAWIALAAASREPCK